MIRRLYDWVIRLAGHPRAIPALGVVSFLESSFFPIPPDVMLIPMVLANRAKAFRIAAVCTVCSVLGGLLGYAIGYYFFETPGGMGGGGAITTQQTGVRPFCCATQHQ